MSKSRAIEKLHYCEKCGGQPQTLHRTSPKGQPFEGRCLKCLEEPPDPLLTFTLTRHAYMPFGTFGFLEGPEIRLATCERPWLGNKRWLSCIPEGTYHLVCGYWNRKKRGVVEVHQPDDSPRSHILIHPANLPEEVHGCIALGYHHGCLMSRWGVQNSRSAVAQFEASIGFNGDPQHKGKIIGELVITQQKTITDQGPDGRFIA